MSAHERDRLLAEIDRADRDYSEHAPPGVAFLVHRMAARIREAVREQHEQLHRGGE